MTPAERVDAACDRWGEDTVVRRCAALLGLAADTAPTGDDLDLAMVLGGLRDRDWLAGGRPPGVNAYWARVWAVRALRYVWAEPAAPAVVDALGDDHWRVREMAAKVVGDRQIGEAADHLVTLLGDDTPRVRAAAVRALGEVGEGEHSEVVMALTSDSDRAVAAAARSALAALCAASTGASDPSGREHAMSDTRAMRADCASRWPIAPRVPRHIGGTDPAIDSSVALDCRCLPKSCASDGDVCGGVMEAAGDVVFDYDGALGVGTAVVGVR